MILIFFAFLLIDAQTMYKNRSLATPIDEQAKRNLKASRAGEKFRHSRSGKSELDYFRNSHYKIHGAKNFIK